MELASFKPFFPDQVGKKNSLVLQEISNNKGVFSGLIGLCTVGALQEKLILPHEKVLQARFSSIADAFLKSGVINKPVLLSYPEHPAVGSLVQDWSRVHECSHAFRENDTSYKYWVIDDSDKVAELINVFREVPLCYIADGHHRMGAIRHLYESNLVPNAQMLSALFSFKHLRINPYHRLVVLRQPAADVLAKLATHLEPLAKQKSVGELATHTLAIQHRQQITHFRWRSAALSSYASDALDAQLFDEIILRTIFQIDDASASDRVRYFPDDQSVAMAEELSSREDTMGFYLPAVELPQFMNSCEQGIMMPPKSTYFEPRLMSGHLYHKFVNDAQD